jgi:hypothetical protein
MHYISDINTNLRKSFATKEVNSVDAKECTSIGLRDMVHMPPCSGLNTCECVHVCAPENVTSEK